MLRKLQLRIFRAEEYPDFFGGDLAEMELAVGAVKFGAVAEVNHERCGMLGLAHRFRIPCP